MELLRGELAASRSELHEAQQHAAAAERALLHHTAVAEAAQAQLAAAETTARVRAMISGIGGSPGWQLASCDEVPMLRPVLLEAPAWAAVLQEQAAGREAAAGGAAVGDVAAASMAAKDKRIQELRTALAEALSEASEGGRKSLTAAAYSRVRTSSLTAVEHAAAAAAGATAGASARLAEDPKLMRIRELTDALLQASSAAAAAAAAAAASPNSRSTIVGPTAPPVVTTIGGSNTDDDPKSHRIRELRSALAGALRELDDLKHCRDAEGKLRADLARLHADCTQLRGENEGLLLRAAGAERALSDAQRSAAAASEREAAARDAASDALVRLRDTSAVLAAVQRRGEELGRQLEEAAARADEAEGQLQELFELEAAWRADKEAMDERVAALQAALEDGTEALKEQRQHEQREERQHEEQLRAAQQRLQQGWQDGQLQSEQQHRLLVEAMQQAEAASAEVSRLRAERADLKQRLAQLVGAQGMLQELLAASCAAQGEVDSLTRKMEAAARSSAEAKKAAAAVEARLNVAVRQQEAAGAEVLQLRARLETAQSELRELRDEAAGLRQRCGEAEERAQQLQRDVDELHRNADEQHAAAELAAASLRDERANAERAAVEMEGVRQAAEACVLEAEQRAQAAWKQCAEATQRQQEQVVKLQQEERARRMSAAQQHLVENVEQQRRAVEAELEGERRAQLQDAEQRAMQLQEQMCDFGMELSQARQRILELENQAQLQQQQLASGQAESAAASGQLHNQGALALRSSLHKAAAESAAAVRAEARISVLETELEGLKTVAARLHAQLSEAQFGLEAAQARAADAGAAAAQAGAEAEARWLARVQELEATLVQVGPRTCQEW